MGLETETGFISDLNGDNPAGTDDPSQGDNHIRGIKKKILSTFPNVTGAVTPTHTELNYVDVSSSIQGLLDGKQAAGSYEAADADILKADESDNLSVGFTTDKDALGDITAFTPDLTKEWMKTATATGHVTFSEAVDGAYGACLLYLEIDSGGPYTVTLNSGYRYIGVIPDLPANTKWEVRFAKWYNGTTTIEFAEVSTP